MAINARGTSSTEKSATAVAVFGLAPIEQPPPPPPLAWEAGLARVVAAAVLEYEEVAGIVLNALTLYV